MELGVEERDEVPLYEAFDKASRRIGGEYAEDGAGEDAGLPSKLKRKASVLRFRAREGVRGQVQANQEAGGVAGQSAGQDAGAAKLAAQQRSRVLT